MDAEARKLDRHPGLDSELGRESFLAQANRAMFGTEILFHSDQLAWVDIEQYALWAIKQTVEAFRLEILWLLAHKVQFPELRLNKTPEGEVQILIPKSLSVPARKENQLLEDPLRELTTFLSFFIPFKKGAAVYCT